MDRRDWRIVMTWHVAETREQARKEAREGLMHWHNEYTVGTLMRPGVEAYSDPDEAVDKAAFGDDRATVIGTPDDLKVIEALVRDEGLELKPYRDSVGKLTIGVGRNLDDKGVSEAEARMLLARDVDDAWRDLDNNCPWWTAMPEPAQAALLNQCFNMGWPRLSTFKKMLAELERGDYHGAAAKAEDSKWFRQVGERGKRVAELYRDSMSV